MKSRGKGKCGGQPYIIQASSSASVGIFSVTIRNCIHVCEAFKTVNSISAE